MKKIQPNGAFVQGQDTKVIDIHNDQGRQEQQLRPLAVIPKKDPDILCDDRTEVSPEWFVDKSDKEIQDLFSPHKPLFGLLGLGKTLKIDAPRRPDIYDHDRPRRRPGEHDLKQMGSPLGSGQVGPQDLGDPVGWEVGGVGPLQGAHIFKDTKKGLRVDQSLRPQETEH